MNSTFGLLGSWFSPEVALRWLFPYIHLLTPPYLREEELQDEDPQRRQRALRGHAHRAARQQRDGVQRQHTN
jgi:hypothetical protein